MCLSIFFDGLRNGKYEVSLPCSIELALNVWQVKFFFLFCNTVASVQLVGTKKVTQVHFSLLNDLALLRLVVAHGQHVFNWDSDAWFDILEAMVSHNRKFSRTTTDEQPCDAA